VDTTARHIREHPFGHLCRRVISGLGRSRWSSSVLRVASFGFISKLRIFRQEDFGLFRGPASALPENYPAVRIRAALPSNELLKMHPFSTFNLHREHPGRRIVIIGWINVLASGTPFLPNF
jgi:hypothetical protein